MFQLVKILNLFELVGLQVVLSNGDLLGDVQDVQSFPAQDILIVRTKDAREIMIPFVKELVPDVSFSQNRIVVKNIEGLFYEEES